MMVFLVNISIHSSHFNQHQYLYVYRDIIICIMWMWANGDCPHHHYHHHQQQQRWQQKRFIHFVFWVTHYTYLPVLQSNTYLFLLLLLLLLFFLRPPLSMLMFHIVLCHSIVILTLPLLIRSSKRRHQTDEHAIDCLSHSELFTTNISKTIFVVFVGEPFTITRFFNTHEIVGSDLNIYTLYVCVWICVSEMKKC